MTEPVKLPERNEILKLLRTKAEICRTEWLRSERGDIYNSAVIMEFAQVATPGNILLLLDYLDELTRQVESLKQERDDFREGFRLFLRKSECMTEEDTDGEIFSWVKEVRDDRP
jgi:hypothetical protein